MRLSAIEVTFLCTGILKDPVVNSSSIVTRSLKLLSSYRWRLLGHKDTCPSRQHCETLLFTPIQPCGPYPRLISLLPLTSFPGQPGARFSTVLAKKKEAEAIHTLAPSCLRVEAASTLILSAIHSSVKQCLLMASRVLVAKRG